MIAISIVCVLLICLFRLDLEEVSSTRLISKPAGRTNNNAD